MKNILQFGLFASDSILILMILPIIVLLIESPGKPRPFLDKDGKPDPGSIAVIETVHINGLDQRMIIRGRDTTKPVLYRC